MVQVREDGIIPEWHEFLLMLFVFTVLAAAGFQYWMYGPPELLQTSDEPATGDRLVFTVEQAEELNDVYERREYEWSWCMDVDGEQVDEIVHPKNSSTTETSASSLCTAPHLDGTVHTHPSGSAIPSHEDRVGSMRYMCLMHGEVAAEDGVRPQELDCYLNLDGDGIEEIPVLFEKSTA